MTKSQFNRIKEIVDQMNIGWENRARFDAQSKIEVDISYGKSDSLIITDSMKSVINTTVIEENRRMIEDCEQKLIHEVSKLSEETL